MRIARLLGLALTAALAALLLASSFLLRFHPAPTPELSAEPAVDSLPWRGLARRYTVYAPAEPAPEPPLVLVFHGSDGDAQQARAGFGFDWDRLADEHGFVVAYPEGYERHWNDCRAAAPYAANRLDVDDVGFVRALVDRLVASRGVDRGRVYATGISNGGQMVLRLALEAPDLLRAAAPVIASLPADDNLDCTHSGTPVPLLLLNGTDDPMNPWQGGEVALYGVVGHRGAVRSSEATAGYFAALAGYDGPTGSEALPDRAPDDGTRIEVTRWRAPGKPPVELVAVVGGGHTVPHPVARFPRLLGRTSADASAAELIWAFFAAVP